MLLAPDELDNDETEIQVFADGSAIDGGVGAAAILYRRGVGQRIARKYTDEHTVFKAELLGAIMGFKMLIQKKADRYAVSVDNQAVIQTTREDTEAYLDST